MITLTIDGKKVEVPEGTNLVEAAKAAGIEIPTYCYHPGLSAVGQCRVCMVEVEGVPKLLPACATQAREGMVVHTNTEKVKKAREAVLEFLLVNHPLECPVCDKAGECLLQDHAFEHARPDSRMLDSKRVYPGLRTRELGPHVIQNQDRCIHCTRCIRFTREIAETWDLTMKSRGAHQYVDTFNGKPFDNPWSACVTDVCPTGALTLKEFRFKERVWNLKRIASVCPGCGVGCNVWIEYADGSCLRVRPRENPEVNGWWLCDYGRFLTWEVASLGGGVPKVGGEEVDFDKAVDEAVSLLKGEEGKLLLIVSGRQPLEAIYLAIKLFEPWQVVVPEETGSERKVKNGRGNWTSSVRKAPNIRGAVILGARTVASDLEEKVREADSVVLLGSDASSWFQDPVSVALLEGKLKLVISPVLTTEAEPSAFIPSASWAGTTGTYVNDSGIVQLTESCEELAGGAPPSWQVLCKLAAALGREELVFSDVSDLFERMASSVPAFAGMSHHRIRASGGMPAGAGAAEGEVQDVG